MQDKTPSPILRVIRRSRSWSRVIFDVVRPSSGVFACLLIDGNQSDIVFEFVDDEEQRGVGASARAAPTPRPTPGLVCIITSGHSHV
jgi:hypothetical protein